MRLNSSLGIDGVENHVQHDVRGSFGKLLRDALSSRPVFAALGPIYVDDPAAQLLTPFRRSASEAGWQWNEEAMVPELFLERARDIRTAALTPLPIYPERINEWTRAGLVLEIARRRGFKVQGLGEVTVDWKLRGTVTGRFGVESSTSTIGKAFNPLTIPATERHRVRPSASERHIATLDFRAMDVCSMIAIVPGLSAVYGDHPDPHQRTAELTGLTREEAKLSFLTWAYGGLGADQKLFRTFRDTFEMVYEFTRPLEHGVFPRMVQTVSAQAFKAALSRALPLLVSDHLMPMFTVHDELTLDVSEVGLDRLAEVTKALEAGASQTIGVPYRVGVSTGYTYGEAKAK